MSDNQDNSLMTKRILYLEKEREEQKDRFFKIANYFREHPIFFVFVLFIYLVSFGYFFSYPLHNIIFGIWPIHALVICIYILRIYSDFSQVNKFYIDILSADKDDYFYDEEQIEYYKNYENRADLIKKTILKAVIRHLEWPFYIYSVIIIFTFMVSD